MPADPCAVRCEHLEAFVGDQVARCARNTARNRYLALKRFFDWLANEGLIDASPMTWMRPPRVPEEPVPVPREEAVRAPFEARLGPDSEARPAKRLSRTAGPSCWVARRGAG